MGEQSTRSVDRALDLLMAVCDGHGLVLSDLARQVGLAPSTTFRLLQSLSSKGFIGRDQSGAYRPGPIMMRLGAASLSQDNLVWVARRHMRQVVESTGESVYLAVEEPTGFALYIQVIEGTHSVRHANWVGRTVPMSGSAVGRALRGRIAPGKAQALIGGVEPDVTAIAAPITTNGHVIAALNLVVPTYRLSAEAQDRFVEILALAASDISASLSQTPSDDADAEATQALGAPRHSLAAADEEIAVV